MRKLPKDFHVIPNKYTFVSIDTVFNENLRNKNVIEGDKYIFQPENQYNMTTHIVVKSDDNDWYLREMSDEELRLSHRSNSRSSNSNSNSRSRDSNPTSNSRSSNSNSNSRSRNSNPNSNKSSNSNQKVVKRLRTKKFIVDEMHNVHNEFDKILKNKNKNKKQIIRAGDVFEKRSNNQLGDSKYTVVSDKGNLKLEQTEDYGSLFRVELGSKRKRSGGNSNTSKNMKGSRLKKKTKKSRK